MEIIEPKISGIFNDMKNDYDDLSDLWYSWLFSRLHYFIAQDIKSMWQTSDQKVLDIGCGTGFQSFLYAAVGAEVVGIDIAEDLIALANEKIEVQSKYKLKLFPSYHQYVRKYNELIENILSSKFPNAAYKKPTFLVGSATNLEFDDQTFSHVNCCGSVLCYVEDYEKAIAEIRRVLKPGGTFVIEVDAKLSMDVFWTLLDSLIGGKLGFETSFLDAMKVVLPPFYKHIFVEYPFGDVSDPIYMNIRLFTKNQLRKDLLAEKLKPLKWRTIHSITNLIPSTFLDTLNPSNKLISTFTTLSKIEEKLPLHLPGCSLVVSGAKDI